MVKLKLSNGGEIRYVINSAQQQCRPYLFSKRRISFPARPTWTQLEARVAELSGLNRRDVAVSYDDGDDVITMSTQEELEGELSTI